MFNIPWDDLGLQKKPAKWVSQLVTKKQKQEQVQTCQEFLATIQRRSMLILENIVMMDETMVCYHTHETRKQSKQWIQEEKPGVTKKKARVQAFGDDIF